MRAVRGKQTREADAPGCRPTQWIAVAICRLPFNVGQQWREAANDAVRVRFHAACYSEWRISGKSRARGALGLEG
jgi:hypothetical protein